MSQKEFISAVFKIIGLIIIMSSVSYTVYEYNEINRGNAALAEMKVTIDRIKSQQSSPLTKDIYDKIEIPLVAKFNYDSLYNLIFSVIGIFLIVGSKRIAQVISDKQ